MIQIQTTIKETTNNEKTNLKTELCAKNSTEKSEILVLKIAPKRVNYLMGTKVHYNYKKKNNKWK